MIKEKVKALWKLCFDDNEEFTEMYFRLRYNNEVNIALQSGDELISALQMLPYPMTFCTEEVATAYISGACTHPDYRANGVMSELLAQSFVRMQQNNVLFSTLIPAEPWLLGYYARMGYAPVFLKTERTLLVDTINGVATQDVTIESTVEFNENHYQYLAKRMAERPCCIQHPAADFKVVLADLALAHGRVFVAKQADVVVAIATAYKKEQTIHISELFADNQPLENQLLYQLGQQMGGERIVIAMPVHDTSSATTLGMARIIDAKAVLQLYAKAHPKVELSINLADNQLSSNNGYYYLCNGKCMHDKIRLPGTYLHLSISQLSDKILSPLNPYMSLMLN